MTQNESKQWKAWRIKRLLNILDLKASGLTDQKTAEKLNISRSTVFRELNSPEATEIGHKLRTRAEGLVMTLIEKQITEIEGDKSLKPSQKLSYRGKLIATLTGLVPKKIEQKLEATGDLNFILETWRPEPEEEDPVNA